MHFVPVDRLPGVLQRIHHHTYNNIIIKSQNFLHLQHNPFLNDRNIDLLCIHLCLRKRKNVDAS